VSADVHPSAVIEPGATIGAGCRIGPFCVVGSDVTLAAGVTLKSHVVVTGRTEIGADSTIWPFASVGEAPQDLKYRGEPTRLIVGCRARIREGATLNTGTDGGGGVTRVGDDCLLMTGAHVGHDCQVGDRVILANCVALGGHVVLGDDVIVGGLSGVHQFVRVGEGAIIGGLSRITRDVLPHALVQGPGAEIEGLNLIGMKRRGMARAEIRALRAAYARLAAPEGTFQERAQTLLGSDSAPVEALARFILDASDRAFLVPR
jgi:UDP-N-acetylglucosamine acyltransferase